MAAGLRIQSGPLHCRVCCQPVESLPIRSGETGSDHRGQ